MTEIEIKRKEKRNSNMQKILQKLRHNSQQQMIHTNKMPLPINFTTIAFNINLI